MFIIVFNNETIKLMVSSEKKGTKMYFASFGFQIQSVKKTHAYNRYILSCFT